MKQKQIKAMQVYATTVLIIIQIKIIGAKMTLINVKKLAKLFITICIPVKHKYSDYHKKQY